MAGSCTIDQRQVEAVKTLFKTMFCEDLTWVEETNRNQVLDIKRLCENLVADIDEKIKELDAEYQALKFPKPEDITTVEPEGSKYKLNDKVYVGRKHAVVVGFNKKNPDWIVVKDEHGDGDVYSMNVHDDFTLALRF